MFRNPLWLAAPGWQHAVLIYIITIFPAIIDLHSWILIKWQYDYLFTLIRAPSTWFPSVMSSSTLDKLSVILSWSTARMGSSCTSCKQQKSETLSDPGLGLGTRADIGEWKSDVSSNRDVKFKPAREGLKEGKQNACREKFTVQFLSNSRANHFYN